MRATHYGFNSFPFVIFVIVIEPTVNGGGGFAHQTITEFE